MYRLITIFASLLFVTNACTQNAAAVNQELNEISKITELVTPSAYKLYATENMWTFLELDTATGIIWQVQYSVKGDDYRFKSTLNRFSLLPEGQKEIAGRFELYKTQNLYNFILVDTRDGRTWQVQWSTEPDDRGIMPIL
jgi:hypothetical protein